MPSGAPMAKLNRTRIRRSTPSRSPCMWGRGGILLRGRATVVSTAVERAHREGCVKGHPTALLLACLTVLSHRRSRGSSSPASTIDLSNLEPELALPRPRTTVVFREVPEGAILFCTETETYFSLNPLGVRIWQLLPPTSSSEDEVVASLSRSFPEVDQGTIASDLRQLLHDLLANGLVEVPQAA